MRLNKANFGDKLLADIRANKLLILKPLTEKILEKIGENVSIYHVKDLAEEHTVTPKNQERRDGSTYVMHHIEGRALVTDNCSDQMVGEQYQTRNIKIMQTREGFQEGYYVSLTDVIEANKAKVRVSADIDDLDNDE